MASMKTVKGILQDMQMFSVFSYGSTTSSWIFVDSGMKGRICVIQAPRLVRHLHADRDADPLSSLSKSRLGKPRLE